MGERFRSGINRLRYGLWPILQTALAATASWYLAVWLFGHEQPLFAAIAAVVTLGIPVGQERSRAVQIVFGVALGIVLAGLLVFVVGTGPAQLALVVALAMLVVAFTGAERLLITQVGISAVLVVTLEAERGGFLFSLDRLLDAILGALVGVLVSALLPIDPEWRTTEAADDLLDALAAVLRKTASALEETDAEEAQAALDSARTLDARVWHFRDAINSGTEAVTISPFRRRRAREHLRVYSGAVDHLELAVRNVRVLSRTAVIRAQSGEIPELLTGAIRDLARAVEALEIQLDWMEQTPNDSERLILEAVGKATKALEGSDDVALNALVSQIRSTATDLLRASGLDQDEALKKRYKAQERASKNR